MKRLHGPIGQPMTAKRGPGHKPHAIKPVQADFRTNPEVPVRILHDGIDRPIRRAITDMPTCYGVVGKKTPKVVLEIRRKRAAFKSED
jgi:hypothetical protein